MPIRRLFRCDLRLPFLPATHIRERSSSGGCPMSTSNRGIDLSYRPSSYFWAKEHGIQLVSDIKGAERRKFYELAIEENLTDLVNPELSQHALSREQRQAQGYIHPAFMGGEY